MRVRGWAVVFCMWLVLVACTVTPAPIPTPPATPGPINTTTPSAADTATATPADTPANNTTPADISTGIPLTPSPATSTAQALPTDTPAQSAGGVPRPDHVVVLIFENQGYAQIAGNACCPYINQQANASALMTNSFALTHPSQPNYLDLFSGSTQGVIDDSCPVPGAPFSTPNLGQELTDAGFTFGGFSEDLPAVGSTVCSTKTYALKHNPWADFSNVPSLDNLPYSSFPTDFTQLPTVSIVVPNICNDMHDCAPTSGDDWLRSNLDRYIQWTATHNSLLIVTFDEDDSAGTNQVTTFFEGPMVKPGKYGERITHYNVLRTLEAMYGLPHAGGAANVATLTDIWSGSTTPTP